MSHLPLNTETVQKQDSVAIFCDFQNVSSIKKYADLLLDFAKIQGNVNWKNFGSCVPFMVKTKITRI